MSVGEVSDTQSTFEREGKGVVKKEREGEGEKRGERGQERERERMRRG